MNVYMVTYDTDIDGLRLVLVGHCDLMGRYPSAGDWIQVTTIDHWAFDEIPTMTCIASQCVRFDGVPGRLIVGPPIGVLTGDRDKGYTLQPIEANPYGRTIYHMMLRGEISVGENEVPAEGDGVISVPPGHP